MILLTLIDLIITILVIIILGIPILLLTGIIYGLFYLFNYIIEKIDK
jgi:hypothetical protein